MSGPRAASGSRSAIPPASPCSGSAARSRIGDQERCRPGRRLLYAWGVAHVTPRGPGPSCPLHQGRGLIRRIERTYFPPDTAGMARRPEPPPKLFWLIYRHPAGAGMVVIESHDLLHARLKASLAGADRGLEVSGNQLDQESAARIPANMIGSFLDAGDLRKLHQMLLKKKPPARSVRRRTAVKRRVGKS